MLLYCIILVGALLISVVALVTRGWDGFVVALFLGTITTIVAGYVLGVSRFEK